jgi:hypothetical protein
VNCEFDPMTFWCQFFWRHKYSLYFYEVFNDFVSVLKGFWFGKDTPRIFSQASKFQDKKGTLEQMENYNVIRIVSSKENPSFLPCLYLTKCLLHNLQGNIIFGYTYLMKKEKINPYLCLGKLGILY